MTYIARWLKPTRAGKLLLIVLAALVNFAFAEPLAITISGGNGELDQNSPAYFYEQLLLIALQKTRETDGDFVLLHNNHGGGIERDRAMLIAGAGIDVMWGSVTREREERMRVVPIDLLKGLNNYRILLISKDDQALFDKVETLDDLKKLSVGAGTHWTDGLIMKDNGFNVTLSSSTTGLFRMLAAHRFRFISRGLHEIASDVGFFPFGLMPEKSLLLKYDKPIRYSFFVNKNNASLAARIERGIRLAQAAGSFDKLFDSVPSCREGEEILKNSHRRVFEIKNNTY